MTTERFPLELLEQPAQARLAYFVGKVVAHPRLREVHDTLLRAIQEPAGASLILVFGPTGVGKTTLRRRLEQQLSEAALPDLERDPGRIPVVSLEAAAGEAGLFNWKDYYTRALLALHEPLIPYKIVEPRREVSRSSLGGTPDPRVAAPTLRRALEQCLLHRRPAAVIVDEAQHLIKLASGRRLLDQMDVLKSLAALTNTVHVLIGTYELVGLTTLSGQLSRRSREVHFGRYRAEVSEDLRAFQSVLFTFQRYLPLAQEPDLVGHTDYLYEQSVGCVGVLKDWLSRALAAALEEEAATLSPRHLERQATPARKLLSLAREIKEGEEALREGGREREDVRRFLGLPPEPMAREASGPEAPMPEGSAHRKARGRGERVAQRLPTRDPVGVREATHGDG
jgi:hypothetical protein